MPNSPSSPGSLERLFQTNVRMSPSRSHKPRPMFKSRRNALNRAAHALTELKKAREKRNQLTRNIEKLEREYYKLARRAAVIIPGANFKTGPLNANELAILRRSAQMTKNMATAARTVVHLGLPSNLRNKVAKMTLHTRR